ncbi:MAG TPA: hypothetical protein VHA06_12165 [Candidatus Angelobacter sp.]|jgi:hypothetical protein|nr:hypothetical protein [Candidatus Angelobacter sp.]
MSFKSAIQSALIVVCCLSAGRVFAADVVNGKVINQTTRRASAGDDVVLLRMGEGMQEEARVRTDAQGLFSVPLAHPAAQYVVRVLHQGVNYDHTLTGTSAMQIEVFDSAKAIKGLQGALGIAQIESEGNTLKVTEMYSISNASLPPVTQTGARNFEMSLPAEAALDSLAAKRSQGLWVNLAAVPVPGKQGSYAVDFPLRPGDTLFKFSYHLPGSSVTTLRLKPAYPVRSFAVMHPPSMVFKSLQPRSFTSPGVVKGLKVEQVVGGVAREVPAFEISGTGTTAQASSVNKLPSAAASAVAASNPVTQPIANSQSEADQRKKDVWAIGSLTSLLIAGGGFALWRRNKRLGVIHSSGKSAPVVQALKDELFQLETEKSRGTMSAEQYSSTREALNLSLRRAMGRKKA